VVGVAMKLFSLNTHRGAFCKPEDKAVLVFMANKQSMKHPIVHNAWDAKWGGKYYEPDGPHGRGMNWRERFKRGEEVETVMRPPKTRSV